MGHRKQSAPRHGSLAFQPRSRTQRAVARIRYWPTLTSTEPRVLGFAGYKAGTTHVMAIDNRDYSLMRGREIKIPVAVLETPPLKVIAVRAYTLSPKGLIALTEVWWETLPKQVSRRIPTMRKATQRTKIDDLLHMNEKIDDVRIIVCTQPWICGFGKNRPEVFELPLSGDLDKKIQLATSLLGHDVNANDVLTEGQYVDVFSMTKGKGFAGVVKRFHVRIMARKSNKTRRGIGTQGAKSPNNIMYTVPRAGQLGYWQRLVRNLRVFKIGSDGKEATANGGFLRYGELKTNYILLAGPVPGPAKRLVRIRFSARRKEIVKNQFQITAISLESKQGV